MMTTTYVMKDGYGEACDKVGANLAKKLQVQVERCVRAVVERTGASVPTFSFCDFGSADGWTTAITAKTIVSQLKESSGPREVAVVLEDQKHNDFRPAFAQVTEALNGDTGDINFVVSAVGRSFYSQCLPTGSLHFGTSNFSLHFLDADKPVGNGELGYSFGLLRRQRDVSGKISALSGADQAQVEANQSKAAIDWEQFLLCRAKELCVGGRLLITSISSVPPTNNEYDRYSFVFRDAYEELELLVNAVSGMVADGEIGEDELGSFVFCAHSRTVEEMQAPFVQADSLVGQAGLQLIRAELMYGEYPNDIDFVKSLSEDEVRRLAAADCRAQQTYLWPLAHRGFAAKAGRSGDEVDRLTKAAFERMGKEMVERRRINVATLVCLVEVEKV